MPERSVVFILIDGARVDVTRHLLERGDLPNLARLLVERGSFSVGTTVFPSTTGVAYLPFLFGLYPGTAGVPGIRWLDRAAAAGGIWQQWRGARSYCGIQAGWLDRDIAKAPSMFDLLPSSIAICTPISRGLDRANALIPVKRAILGSIAHYAGTYQALDDVVANAWIASASRTDWSFEFVVFPGPDGIAHLKDPWHESVLDSYRAIDRALGRFHAGVQRLREPPDYLAVADHGSSVIHTHHDLALELENRGLRTLRHPVSVWRRNAKFAVMVSGNASAQIYLDPRSGRAGPLDSNGIPHDFVESLIELAAVRLAAFRDADGGVRIVSKAGTARVLERQGTITYEPVAGDAIGLGRETIATRDRKLLALTRATELPDAPAQLLQLLRSRRAGDIALAADEGFDFRTRWEIPQHRAGHGSLLADHMLVPILSSRPLPDGPIRTIDLMPTMLDWLGIDPPPGIDGVAARVLEPAIQQSEAQDRT